MVRHGEGQPRDDHVRQRLARHIHALPKTVGAEEHGVQIVLEFFEHEGAWRAGALHETSDAHFVEERLHPFAHFLHQPGVGEQHESRAVSDFHEVLDPIHERVAKAVLARVGHLADHEELHLPLIIEGRADLEHGGRFGADAFGEVKQGRRAAGLPLARAGHVGGRRSEVGGRRRLLCLGRQCGAGHHDGGVGAEEPPTQVFCHLNGRRVEREVLLRLAGPLHPIDMAVLALTEEHRHFFAQISQPAIALRQLLAGVFVLAHLDERADGFAQPLDRQRDGILD